MVCLFCKNEREESDEHPFAAPLGNVNFIVRTVCKPCNEILGADVDSQGDLDARLSHARQSAGLPIRVQSILSTDPAIEPRGKQLRTEFDKETGASVIAPQKDGDEMVVGRDRMRPIVKQMLKARFKKAGQPIADAEANEVTNEVLRKFDDARTGDTITHTHKGLTIRMPRQEIGTSQTAARRHDVLGAINRLSGKIALEIAAYALGTNVMLRPEYDDLRRFVLTGEPDLSGFVYVVREPELEGGDASTEHTVRLEEDAGFLYATIAYYNAYVVRVRIGSATGITGPWAMRFQIEPEC
jgi:hypothetical protein